MATNKTEKEDKKTSRRRTPAKTGNAHGGKVGRAATNEKKAMNLLDEWIDAEHDIELISVNGVAFTGKLTRLNSSGGHRDFLFHNPYGVHQSIYPMLYARVWAEGYSRGSQVVHMEDAGGLLTRVTLHAVERPVTKAQIEQVCDQIRTWAKLGTKLRIMRGDELSMTMFDATAHEHLDHTYMFASINGAFSCAITPSKSAVIKYEYLGNSIVIQLFNTTAKSHFIVTDVIDNAEEALKRFATSTQMIQ